MTILSYRHPLLIAYGNFVFRYRGKIFPIVLALALLAFPAGYAGGDGAHDLQRDGIALGIALLGQILRILTVGLDYIKRGGLNKQVYADHLVTGGIFAHCRNPLYLGNVMIALGLLVMFDDLLCFAIGAVLAIVTYRAIVAAEEAYLGVKFGAAYDAYCRAVNRWLPDPRGLGATLSGASFNWRRVLLKETTSFYAWLLAAFVLDIIEHIGEPNLLGQPDFVLFASLLTVATLGFSAIRLLKSSGRLQLSA